MGVRETGKEERGGAVGGLSAVPCGSPAGQLAAAWPGAGRAAPGAASKGSSLLPSECQQPPLLA